MHSEVIQKVICRRQFCQLIYSIFEADIKYKIHEMPIWNANNGSVDCVLQCKIFKCSFKYKGFVSKRIILAII